MDKSEIAKSVLRNILVVEQAVQGREMSVSEMNLSYAIPKLYIHYHCAFR